VDDSAGVARNLSTYVTLVAGLGKAVAPELVTGVDDTGERQASGLERQEVVLRGLVHQRAATGSHTVLSGLPGKVGTISYGPAGKRTGQVKLTGEFYCRSYQMLQGPGPRQSFEAIFLQDGAVTVTTW
jgi:hypothetical protein